jgi:hypothetical protein
MAVVIAVSSITFSHANTFNQKLRVGIADLNDTEDNFFGVGYQYYFKLIP